MKKILVVIIILAAVGLATFFAWPYLRPLVSQTNSVPAIPPAGPAPTANAQNLHKETDDSIFSYWLTDAGDIIYVDQSGKVYRLSHGNREELILQKIADLQSFVASGDGSYAVAAFGPRLAPTFSLLSVKNKTWQPLPTDVTSVVWDRTRNRLLYLKQTDGLATLNVFDVSTKKTTEIIRFPSQGIKLIWTGTDKVYVGEASSANAGSALLSLNLKNRSVSLFTKDTPGLMSSWAPDGSLGLIFANSFKENALILSDGKGTPLGKPLFGTTLPSKCLVESQLIFCAVPREIPSGIILPDDWLTRKFYSEDKILSFNVKTNEVKTLFDNPTPSIDAEQLNRHGNTLYFVNRYDQKLYSLVIGN